MKRKAFNVFVVLLVLVFCMQTFMAAGRLSPQEVFDKYRGGLNAQEESELETWAGYMQFDMYQEYYDQWISQGIIWKSVVEILLKEGYYVEYYDSIKAANLVSSDFELSKTSVTSDSTNVTAQENITTTKCEEKTMWAKSGVNVRENGSTSYKKVASLKKDEQVTITGIDSTGWYEIRLADGTVGHVSDKYLTEVQPSVNAVSTDTEGKVPEETPAETVTPQRQSEIISIDGRTVVWYNAETGREEEVTFSDSTPLDEVEEFANTYLINGAELVESTPEPTVEPMKESENSIEELESPIPSVEPEAEETQEPVEAVLEKNSSAGNFKYAVVGILVLVVLASIIGILIYKKKK